MRRQPCMCCHVQHLICKQPQALSLRLGNIHWLHLSCAAAGTLPPQWGQSGSLQTLSLLDISNSSVTGQLPDSWGSQLPGLGAFQAPNALLSGEA